MGDANELVKISTIVCLVGEKEEEKEISNESGRSKIKILSHFWVVFVHINLLGS